MTHNEVNSNTERGRRLIFALLCLVLFFLCAWCSAQEAIKLPAKASFKTVETFKNKQGFMLPVSVSDTTNVYKIGDKGTPFYFRQSKKTGQIYKVYLPKTYKVTVFNPKK